ncbi:MAG TPA: hypothetical protein VNO43_04585 [Candidatus Eisenbacteria bacterium]|nr:hypothetical protein [Candidatus Eisenbacteria bacterium]
MNMWEIGTWLSVIILGPGALFVFLFFLRDARRMLRELEKENSADRHRE